MNKEEFLLSLPDSISLTEALSDVARIFTKLSFIYRKKSQGDLEKYICFHKELKWGVYKHKDKYLLVRIVHPPKLFGIEGNSSVSKVTEVLTDTTDHSDLEKKSIRGSTLLGKTSDSEKLFLQAITDEYTKEAFEEKRAEEEAIEKEREKAKADKERERKFEAGEKLKADLIKERKIKNTEKARLKKETADKKAEEEEKRNTFQAAQLMNEEELQETLMSANEESIELIGIDVVDKIGITVTKDSSKKEIVHFLSVVLSLDDPDGFLYLFAWHVREKEKEKEREARILKAKADKERKRKYNEAKLKELKQEYGLEESIMTEFQRGRITLGMPIEMVKVIKGSGHERKRNVTKDGEQIKEKYGKYFKTLSSGVESTTPSYNLQVEYEKNDNNVWVVTGYKDL